MFLSDSKACPCPENRGLRTHFVLASALALASHLPRPWAVLGPNRASVIFFVQRSARELVRKSVSTGSYQGLHSVLVLKSPLSHEFQ